MNLGKRKDFGTIFKEIIDKTVPNIYMTVFSGLEEK